MHTILLVDEHSVYRRGMRALIEDAALARVVESASLRSEVNGIFDLLLIDFSCLDQHSAQHLQIARARNPKMRLAVMSLSTARSDVLSCLSAGFHGYLHKTQRDCDLLQAITDLLSGRIYVPQWVAERQDANVETISASLELESLNLTPRQREVLPLLARGMSAKEIARALNIAVGTTKIHTAALLHALGARNRTEGAFIAARIMRDEGRLSFVHSRPSPFLEVTTKDNDVDRLRWGRLERGLADEPFRGSQFNVSSGD